MSIDIIGIASTHRIPIKMISDEQEKSSPIQMDLVGGKMLVRSYSSFKAKHDIEDFIGGRHTEMPFFKFYVVLQLHCTKAPFLSFPFSLVFFPTLLHSSTCSSPAA